MSEYCDYYENFVSPNGEPEEWEVTWELTLWKCGALYHRVILFCCRFCYVLNFEHFISYVSLL
jgi:hypothetical protein